MSPIALVALLLVALLGWPATVAADDSASARAAAALVSAMKAAGVEAVGAQDPAEAGRFVAALLIPQSQLLVVSTVHPMAAAIQARIDAKEFRQVYLDLQGTATEAGKLFVQDMDADGFGGTAVDVVYVGSSETTLINDDWSVQDLSEAEYRARVQRAETRYVQMLDRLASALTRQAPALTERQDAAEAPAGTPER